MSNSKGLPYFYNKTTGQSIWDSPEDLTEEQIMKLPGAEHLKKASKGAEGGGKEGQVRASHLLVKHNGSRRPSSWKEVRGVPFPAL